MNINNINNTPLIKKGKEGNIQIITKKKEKKPREINSELNDNKQSDFNKLYNLSKNNNISDEHDDKKLESKDLEIEDNNNLMNYNSNKTYKTQEKPRTYLYEKNK